MPGEAHSAVACRLAPPGCCQTRHQLVKMAALVDADAHRLLSSCCVVSLPTKNVTSSGAGDFRTLPTTLVSPCLHTSSARWCCSHNCSVHPDATSLSGAFKACHAVTLPNCREHQHPAGTVPLRQTHSLRSTIMTLEDGLAPNGYARQRLGDDQPQVWTLRLALVLAKLTAACNIDGQLCILELQQG